MRAYREQTEPVIDWYDQRTRKAEQRGGSVRTARASCALTH